MKQENQTQKTQSEKLKEAALLQYADALDGNGPIDHEPRLASAANAVANLIDYCGRLQVSCHVPEENLRDEIDSIRAAFFDVVSNFALLIDSLEQRSQDFQYLKGEEE
jgi:hypothetical protein